MKDLVINKLINYVLRYQNLSNTKVEELKYGLVSIYLLITKLIIIAIISIFLGMFKEMIIFTLCYIPIRATSFGLHATKSWICLITSTTIFVGIPELCKLINIPIYIKIIISSICIVLIFKNSPADTYKRPIISKNRRMFFKYISVLISVLYSFIIILNSNRFICNCLLFSLIIQNFMISPYVYKVFKLPYNNYKKYVMN